MLEGIRSIKSVIFFYQGGDKENKENDRRGKKEVEKAKK
jgi:hypothetical protein